MLSNTSKLKTAICSWALGPDDFLNQPFNTSLAKVKEITRVYGIRPHYEILCVVDTEKYLIVKCDDDFASLVTLHMLLPVKYQVSRNDYNHLSGQISFNQLQISIKN